MICPWCLQTDIVHDSYFDNPLKSHTREACGCGQFTKVTNMPKDFQGIFFRYKRNKAALKWFLAGKLFAHDFIGAIVFISVKWS